MFSLKKCDKTILLFVKIKYVACKIEYMLPTIAYVNVYDIENRINTSRSVNLWFQKIENGWDLAHF